MAVGHPVDIATGTVFNAYKDVDLPGKYPLVWERRYSTALAREAPTALGQGWTCAYFANLTRMGDVYRFRTPEGSLEVMPDPDDTVSKGKVLLNPGAFMELAKHGYLLRVTVWKPETGDVTRYLFQAGENGKPWPLLSVETPEGQGLDLAWDQAGRLKGVRQKTEKRTLSLEYTAHGRVARLSFVQPGGAAILLAHYEYDAAGRLATAYDALGHADRYEYDADGRLLREIVKDGGVFTFKYDDRGRCVRTSGLGNYDLKILRYLDNVLWTEVTDSEGHVYRYESLPSGQVIQEINPLGGVSKTEYDGHGRIAAKIDAMGARTEYAYDDRGNRVSISGPSGEIIALEFDDNHQPTLMVDAGGGKWRREYDGAGRQIAAENPLGLRWTYRYDGAGNLVKVTDPAGNSRSFKRHPNGDLAESTDWAGYATRYDWDGFGRLRERIDPKGYAIRFAFNLMGRPTGILYPDGSRVLAAFDAAGNLVSYTGCDGRTVRLRFGTCGRLLSATDPSGLATSYHWGTEPRRLIRIVNGKGEEHRFFYNGAGRMIKEITFDGRVLNYMYDAAGRNTRFVNGEGRTLAYEFNARGRMTRKVWPDGTETTYAYDKIGNMIEAKNPTMSVSFERDPLGRVVRETQGSIVLETVFDAVGNPVRIATSAGHSLDTEFDPRGFATGITADNTHAFRMDRDAIGREIRRALPNGLGLAQTFDGDGRLTGQILAGDGIPLDPIEAVRREFRYEPGGRLLGIRDDRWSDTRYEYDQADRLMQVLGSQAKESFTYDACGNITSKSRDDAEGGDRSQMAYGPGNRILAMDGWEFSYDGCGRLVGKNRRDADGALREWTYAWDADDQLISLRTPAGEVWKYGYDALGRRVVKEGGGKPLRYVWERKALIQVLDGDAPSETWVFSPHAFAPLAKLKGGVAYPILTDHLGTPREMYDGGGRLVWAACYDAWGRVLRAEPDTEDCSARFPGQWLDAESGLHYSLFRYYDPGHGHFLCPDPVGLKAGANEYLYARNPVNFTDPYGLCPGDSEDDPVIIIIDADRYPQAAAHIRDNGPVVGQIDRPGASSRRRASLRDHPPVPGMDRDEVPPAVLSTGGAGASVRPIPPGDNRGAGSTMGHQMRDLDNDTWVEIRSSED